MVTIADTDTTMRQVMGRVAGLLVPWQTPESSALPLLCYAHIATTPIGGVGDTRTCLLQLTAWAEGLDAQATCHALLERCESLFSSTALLAAGVDAAPIAFTRRGTPLDPEGSRVLARADLDIELYVTA